MNAKDRLLEFLKFKNIGQTKFEELVEISRGYIYNNKGSIGSGIINKISSKYPELNTDWLLTGTGTMLKTDVDIEAKPISDIQFLNIPFVPIYAQAGYGRGYGDQEYIDNLPTLPVIVDKNYRGKYRVFEVDGDSMDNGTRSAIFDGDKILCREVRHELWTSKLHIKDWYFVICMKNDGITVKQITSHNVKSECTFYSWKHTGVCELYNTMKKKDVYAIMRQCRHSDIKMTMIYLRSLGLVVNEDVREW